MKRRNLKCLVPFLDGRTGEDILKMPSIQKLLVLTNSITFVLIHIETQWIEYYTETEGTV